MRIQHNIMAMSAYRNYTNNVSAMKKNLEKLSSGYKINRAGDDAAGLAISEKMRAQITGLETAQKNAKDGISLVQTAEGALTEVHDMLNRMVELATQSANGTYDNDTDRAQMQKEVEQLKSEIDRIADSSNFNGINLLDGTLGLNKAAFTLSDTDPVEASDVTSTVVGTQTAATNTANTVTKLHIDGTKGVAGEFTVYLGQAKVSAPTNAASKASIQITIGTVAKTIAATAAGKEFTADKIASQWLAATGGTTLGGGGKFMYVTAGGTMGFKATASAAATAGKAKGLVYEGTANADGSITYKLKGYVNAKSSAIVAVASDGSNLTAANVGSGAFIDLNLDVAIASGTKGTVTVNAANVGTNATNSVMQKDDQMGSNELELNVDELEDGMVISINGVKKTVKFADASTGDIDLSKCLTASGALDAANKKAEIMNAIATAFKGQVTGIDVGVNASENLTLSENKNASEDVKKAMSKEDTFKKLVQVEKPAVPAGKQITFTQNKIVDGDVLSITKGKTTTKYVFTKDMTGKTDSATTKYIDIKGKSDDEVAAAFAEKAGLTADDNAVTVTDGTLLGRGLTLQIGDTSDDFNQLNVAVQNMHAADLGIGDLSIADEVSAQKAIQKIKDAINTVSDVRGTLGATQNRLDHTINNLSVMTENIQDAESTIRDVDVAEEMMAYTKNNILIQSAQAMLAQANQVPQGVLQLLG